MSTLPATRLKRLVVPADPGTSCGATWNIAWSQGYTHRKAWLMVNVFPRESHALSRCGGYFSCGKTAEKPSASVTYVHVGGGWYPSVINNDKISENVCEFPYVRV